MRGTPFWTRAALLTAAGLYVVLLLRTSWVSDDAFITLRVVENTLHGFGPRWNIDERVQVFTHPLWFLALTAVEAVGRNAYLSALALGWMVSLLAVLRPAFGLASRDAWTAAGFVTALALSRAFLDYSTSGLENPLTHLVLGLFAVEALRVGSWDDRRVLRAALWAGLLATNRMDAVLFVAPALALIVATRGVRSLRLVAAGFAPFLAWESFALLYYGSPWPNPALAKLGTGTPAGELLGQGVLYFADAVRHDPITPALIVGGLAAAFVRRGPMRLALGGGLALSCLYVLRVGGDFMAGRFLSAPAFLGALLLADAAAGVAGRARFAVGGALLALGAAVAVPVLADPHYASRVTEMIRESGVADERRFYFSSSGLFCSPGGRHLSDSDPFVIAGRDLSRNHVSLTLQRSIGYVAFAAGPSVHIVDTFALADPFLARLPADRNDNWRIGHFRRTPPTGYLATLAGGKARIEDPGAAALWERVARLTRGPLFSTARLSDIVASALGRLGAPSRPLRPGGDPWSELASADPSNPEPHYALALEASRRGDLASFRVELERTLAIAPEHERALVDLAELCARSGELQDAGRLLARAGALEPLDPRAVRAGAALAETRGDPEMAFALYSQSRALNPGSDGRVDARLAALEARRGNGEEARRWIARAGAISGDDPETATQIGAAYAAMGMSVEARAALERALAADPAYAPAASALRALPASSR